MAEPLSGQRLLWPQSLVPTPISHSALWFTLLHVYIKVYSDLLMNKDVLNILSEFLFSILPSTNRNPRSIYCVVLFLPNLLINQKLIQHLFCANNCYSVPGRCCEQGTHGLCLWSEIISFLIEERKIEQENVRRGWKGKENQAVRRNTMICLESAYIAPILIFIVKF